MTRRTILLVAALVLLLGGGAVYYWTAVRAAAAADCAEKPKPKDEFAMAAECDGGEAAPQGTPATPR